MEFLFTVMLAAPRRAPSASFPVTGAAPQVDQHDVAFRAARDDRKPRGEHFRHAGGVRLHLRLVALNSGWSASLSATAFAAMTCMRGPPCVPGRPRC